MCDNMLLARLDDVSGKAKSGDAATEQEVICEKRSPDGSTHDLTIQQLKQCLAKVGEWSSLS